MFVYISVSSDNKNEKTKVMLDWRVTIYYNLLHRYAFREISLRCRTRRWEF